jgi:type IV secretion system protein VirB9
MNYYAIQVRTRCEEKFARLCKARGGPAVHFPRRRVDIRRGGRGRQATAAGAEAVRESNNAGIAAPSEYSHAAMVYDFHPDWAYEIYAQPLRVTDIILEPGERAVDPPFISDSDRWILGAGVSYSGGAPVQHIYVKPIDFPLEATLIVNTDRRAYHIFLRSYKDLHMPMVRWRYPSSGLPSSFIPPPGSASAGAAEAADGSGPATIDPRYLSFNYKITYGMFQKPAWMPELVFDDGQKTYVMFPEAVLQRELPAVFENRKDVLNYRVVGKLLIFDKLIESVTVKIEKKEIDISKKRG